MTIAEQALTRALSRRLARSVVIKDADAFQALFGQLQTALTNAWDEAMREGISAALDRLRDLGPGAFTQEDGAAILRVLEGSVGAEALRAAMREPVINLTDALYRVGAEEVGQATGVAIAFQRPDLDALDVLKTGNLFWIGDSWNIRHQRVFAEALEAYFTEGLSRQDLAERFARDFAGLTERSRAYWLNMADHTASRTREIGRVTGYERAGIARVQVRAQLDERTTRICRQMHGRVIKVSALRAQADAWLEATSRRDQPAAYAAWTMHGSETDFSTTRSSELPGGTAGPQYHFRCRTITVAYFGAPDGVAGIRQRVTDRDPIGAEDRAALVAQAQGAGFLGERQARAKFQRHRANIPTRRLVQYEADARALISDPEAALLLSTRVPGRNRADRPGEAALHAVFARPTNRRSDGTPGQLVTIVDLEDGENGRIISHHWRPRLTSDNDLSPAMTVTKSKGVLQWLTAFLRRA